MKARKRPYVSDWLQDVPEEWPVPLLRLVTRVESGHTPSRGAAEYWVPDECTIPWFSLADIWQLREGRQKFLGETKECISPSGIANSSARILPPGTVVLSRTASVGFSGLMPRPMATTQDFVNFVCGDKLVPDFLLWVLRGMKPEFERLSMGSTHMTIYMPDLLQFRVPLPPVPRQHAIANFLDRKTAALDVLLEKKERIIALLAEKRAAVIHRAVTKGLNPDAPKKASGIAWIGEIPAHWACAPLYSRYETQLGKMLDTQRIVGGELRPYVRNADIQWSGVNIANLHQMDFSPAERMRYRLRPGDLLVCEGGANEKIVGRSAIWIGRLDECYFQKALHRVRPTLQGENPQFLLYALRAAVSLGVFVAGANPNTVFHLTGEKLRAHRFAFPPANEQNDIVREVENELKNLETLDGHVRQQLDRLREYRQALITAAVTGQLDIGEPSK